MPLAPLSLALLAFCRPSRAAGGPPEPEPAAVSISSSALLAHIRALASDDFEGRAPGSRGEERTLAYLTEQFRRLGLEPGGTDGSYLQPVVLLGSTAEPEASFESGGRSLPLRFPEEYVAATRLGLPEVRVDGSEVVFVGYGIVAPEYGWDDYKGLDVRGKTLLMLVNDPPVRDPGGSGLDPATFKGKAMTYYGRWTYKYEIASEKGAAAAVIIHETEPASYPYEVVMNSFGRENFDIPGSEGSPRRVAVEAWVSSAAAKAVLSMAGRTLDELKTLAARRDFRPVPLSVRARFALRNRTREVRSANVAAALEGSDPALKDEWVVYVAHWDHLGMDERLPGDRVYNGALDNASGVAALLELARAFAGLPVRTGRSLLFLSTTAEEKGLLGAKYYAEHLLRPLKKTAAAINIDGVNVWGRTRDILSIGLGHSTLDEIFEETARGRGRRVGPDARPEKGSFFRSDHFEFAKKGVPSLYYDSGTEFIGKDPDFSRRKKDEYTALDYHKVSDEIKPDWDLSGAVEDLELLLELGLRTARSRRRPEWKDGSEFKPRAGGRPEGTAAGHGPAP